MVMGKMARSRWMGPKESQEVQAKKASQQNPEIVKAEMMAGLLHKNVELPPS